MKKLGPHVRVRAIKLLDGLKMVVIFDNDSQKEIELEPVVQ